VVLAGARTWLIQAVVETRTAQRQMSVHAFGVSGFGVLSEVDAGGLVFGAEPEFGLLRDAATGILPCLRCR
jgi:hypothetical protein